MRGYYRNRYMAVNNKYCPLNAAPSHNTQMYKNNIVGTTNTLTKISHSLATYYKTNNACK